MALIDLSQIVNLVYFASFFLIFFYGQRLQVQWQLVSVKRSLGKLERSKTAARQKFVDSISRFQMDKKTVETKIDRLNNSFTITPVSLDPSGIVGKLEHVLDTYDDHLKMEVKAIAPNATESDVNTLSNQLEISIGLDGMFRLVRHFYLLAKKTGGIMALAQLQMALPMIMEEAEAYGAAIDAFAKAQPIGDGVGPLVVSQIVAGRQGNELIKDTMVYDVDFEGRRVWVVRAKGPGGNVGKPGLVVEKLVQESGPIGLVVTVDAALKFEGEPSGDVAEGIGAAIGGPGTERYHIEASASKNQIPLLAVVVKMSSKEAISGITPLIKTGVEVAVTRVQNEIRSKSKPGDSIILVGVGNTIGVP